MPSDTCNTCADILCPEQGNSEEYKCSAYAARSKDAAAEEARQKAIRNMKIAKGRDLCRSPRVIIFKDHELVAGLQYFKEEDYLLIAESIHFLPRLHTQKFRPALEITLERSSGHFQIIILAERGDSKW